MMYTVKPEQFPIPDYLRVGDRRVTRTKYPDSITLKVGESVCYPGSMFEEEDGCKRLVSSFKVHAAKNKKRFVHEYQEDGGVRIWRVE